MRNDYPTLYSFMLSAKDHYPLHLEYKSNQNKNISMTDITTDTRKLTEISKHNYPLKLIHLNSHPSYFSSFDHHLFNSSASFDFSEPLVYPYVKLEMHLQLHHTSLFRTFALKLAIF